MKILTFAPRLGATLDRWSRRLVPEPFVLAVGLAFATSALAWATTEASVTDVASAFGDGFFVFLAFGMQMCLVLVTGHALATSPPVTRVVDALAARPRDARGATLLVAASALAAGLVHWGLGIVVGALMAREVGRRATQRGIAVHYPLLGAAGYAGLLVWHGGLSGSIPLLIAGEQHFLVERIGSVPVTETLASPLNVATSVGLAIVIPLTLVALLPPAHACRPPALESTDAAKARDARAFAGGGAARLERSRGIAIATGAAGLAVLAVTVAARPGLDLDRVNLAFLFLGVLAQGSLGRYVRAVEDGARACAGIILQFPFYAGIMGVMKDTGLAADIAGAFVALAERGLPARLFPVLAFLSAGLLNLFVPSGGGQWGVQGLVMVDAAERLGVPISTTAMAVAYGDEWTNALQPFWALPLLGITGLAAREIIGYSAVLLVTTGAVFVAALLLVPG